MSKLQNHGRVLLVVLVVLVVAMGVWRCRGTSVTRTAFDESLVSLGVVETRENRSSSRVVFYDDELNELGALSLPYAGVGSESGLTTVRDGMLYLVPKGLMGKRDERALLKVDLTNLGVTKIPLDRINIYEVVATDEHLFAVSNLNGSSFLSRYGLRDEKVIEVELSGVYVTSVCPLDNHLLVFCSNAERAPTLMVCDFELNSLQGVSLVALGSGQYRTRTCGAGVIICSWSNVSGTGTSSRLGIWHPESGELETFSFSRPVYDALPLSDGRLFVVLGTMHDGANGATARAMVFDPSDPEAAKIAADSAAHTELGYAVNLCAARGDTVYLVDSERTIHELDCSRGIIEVRATTVSKMDGSHSYLSSIFVL